MEIQALLTSAGINIGICCLLFSLYSILRKQPSNKYVYFGRRLAKMRSKRQDPYWFDRFVPSPGWIIKAWETSEDVILAVGGLDALVFVRTLVLSVRIFSIAAIVCTTIVLPLNYYGQDIQHKVITFESLEVFTTQNVKPGSRWLWAHCLALYIISISSCILLYFEYKSIIRRRLAYNKVASRNLSQFAVLVRGVPWSPEDSYDTTVKNYFTKYFPFTYLSHQMVYQSGKIDKIVKNVIDLYDSYHHAESFPTCSSCGIGGRSNALDVLVAQPKQLERDAINIQDSDLHSNAQECASAFVFFRSRNAASCAAQNMLSSNPTVWVTHLAPEPNDVYWSNLAIPYSQFWLRKIATFLATALFLLFFIAPVTLVQGLANLDKIKITFPFLKGILRKKYMSQLVTGYLPSVILILFFYTVPPLMIIFSTIEGSISRSARKKAACCKVLFFTIWNVFFVNIGSGTLFSTFHVFSQPKYIPLKLASKSVPAAVKFFMSYVLTSGWTGLACEVVQLYPLLYNFIYKFILRKKKNPFANGYTFPYHTELPRVLLFGLLGLVFAVLAPLILPLLLIYYCLAYLVYRNQILNVYVTEYDSGGKYWPIVYGSTIFSLVLAQIIAMGVFAMKDSTLCLCFTVPLTASMLLFNEYCKRRFLPLFRHIAAEVLIEMDQQDEQRGKMEEVHEQLLSAYTQFYCNNFDSTRIQSHYFSDDEECVGISQQLSRPGSDSSRENTPSEYSQEITPSEEYSRKFTRAMSSQGSRSSGHNSEKLDS